ncbi:hypothetical protein PoB_001724300 [Plakobranchus ocellatus]|uniref:Uncharacterized protein n=1 Tax=Plakobranchus ocellatus TaxID=259542 RepID=A0AAV3Z7N9_9GAST|nr:hypothetical protein PoB_001724300 [Plakobranchus ocellatus]
MLQTIVAVQEDCLIFRTPPSPKGSLHTHHCLSFMEGRGRRVNISLDALPQDKVPSTDRNNSVKDNHVQQVAASRHPVSGCEITIKSDNESTLIILEYYLKKQQQKVLEARTEWPNHKI